MNEMKLWRSMAWTLALSGMSEMVLKITPINYFYVGLGFILMVPATYYFCCFLFYSVLFHKERSSS
jgi:hypothetical protein